MSNDDNAFAALLAAASDETPLAYIKYTNESSPDNQYDPDEIEDLIDFYVGRTAELLAQETRFVELLGEFNEQSALIDAYRVASSAEQMKRKLGREISSTAGQQTAGYSKAGVALAGTPALLLKDTYEKGAEDIMALEEAVSFEEQQLKLSGALAKMEAMQQATRIRSSYLENLGWDLNGLLTSTSMVSQKQTASLGAGGYQG